MSDAILAVPEKIPSRAVELWKSFARNRAALVSSVVLVVLVLLAICASVVAPHDPIEQFRKDILLPPAWLEGGKVAFPLGTDDIGRDILSRLLHGAQLSILIGIIVVTISLVVGCALGLVAAFFGGLIDTAIMRVMDILLVFPGLVLAVVVVAVVGPGLFNAMLAVAIVMMPSFTRLTRASALRELSREYVSASRSAGAGRFHLMVRTVFPNCVAPLIIQATLGFANAILDAAALGFLGLGAQPPTPEWGTMLSGSLAYLQSAWWMVTFPGACILVTVICFNLVGDGLRDALDPKLRR
ncbi:ABC transporter permease subunit [Microvirga brassicacearum]|uniref:ABC transporter permease subunit n=1 Tax=Microvirga brassicacearum TaxID=2580413 RepID=A0A5N3PJL4_9HYPH|nr:ABC transporter permease subunit [Microvirga brassicacearum]KAB0269785.1 ABC transporter permease subunit [Microvirga brassicacearum]